MPIPGTQARFDRFHVGQIACTAVSDGGILVPLPPPPAAPAGAAESANKPPAFLLVPLACLVVQMPQDGPVVLFDSGFGLTPESLGKPMQSAGQLLASLEAAGLSADRIDLVLISHFDIDHVAGLYKADGSQVFGNATYYASAEAVEFWSEADVDLSASPVFAWVKQERLLVSAHLLKHAGQRLKTFRAGDEVVAGIRVLDLPGHAPGQVGFEITSDGESLVYTADAITHAVVSLETPDVFNLMDLDPHTAVTTRKALLASLSEAGSRSFSPHFPFPGWGRVQKAGEKHVWKAGE